MKHGLLLFCLLASLFTVPVPAAGENVATNFVFFLDAGSPIQQVEIINRAWAPFLGLSGQARLAGDLFAECSFAVYYRPRPHFIFDGSNGYKVEACALWKFPQVKKIRPFVKLGLSCAWIHAHEVWPDTDERTDDFLGPYAGGGAELSLGRAFLLRLGGVLHLYTKDGRQAFPSWGEVFAGFGIWLN